MPCEALDNPCNGPRKSISYALPIEVELLRETMSLVDFPSLLIAAALAAAAPSDALAQNTIKSPAKIVIGFGSLDTVARTIAEGIRESTGEVVIIDERPGASGRVAAEMFKSAAPDGRTLLLSPAVVHILAPLVFKHLDYDPTKDFAPVSHIARFQFAFAVGAAHPARTMTEFVAWVKAHPDQANYGSIAAGSFAHFFGVMACRAAGIEMVHIPYNGPGPLTADMMGGHVAAGISAVSDLIELHRAGRIRILATSGTERSPLLPEVPTFKDAGFAAVEATGWIAIYAPASTPASVVDRWSAVITRVMRMPAVKERFISLGLEATGTTPAELAAIMAADTARWAPIIKASGFTAD